MNSTNKADKFQMQLVFTMTLRSQATCGCWLIVILFGSISNRAWELANRGRKMMLCLQHQRELTLGSCDSLFAIAEMAMERSKKRRSESSERVEKLTIIQVSYNCAGISFFYKNLSRSWRIAPHWRLMPCLLNSLGWISSSSVKRFRKIQDFLFLFV